MCRCLILVTLMFVSSVCYAHQINGVWHESSVATPGQSPHAHHNTTPLLSEQTPQPSTFGTPISDDTTAQDESDATATTVNPTPLVSLPSRVFTTVKPPMITEYMLRDWSREAGGGLPQWIELYNPNATPMNLEGYQFTHAYKRFANQPWTYVTASITGFTIPASDAAIIANKNAGTGAWQISGISNNDVWMIPHDGDVARLKNGWYLTDANGNVVHRIGTAFREYPADDSSDWDASLGQPGLPAHTSEGYRVSFQHAPSESPDAEHFYGYENDVGSPGFYEAAAPSAPSLQRPKLTTTWGHLKQGKKPGL